MFYRVKFKEGIHFPMVNQLLKIVKTNELMSQKMKQRKEDYKFDEKETTYAVIQQ
jgi:hypothetical protein